MTRQANVFNPELGKSLRERRQAKGVKIVAVCAAIGVDSPTTVLKWEKGEREIRLPLSKWKTLLGLYGVSEAEVTSLEEAAWSEGD